MNKQNMTAITSNSNSKPVLPRDTDKVLKVKTGLKGGEITCDDPGGKSTPILF